MNLPRPIAIVISASALLMLAMPASAGHRGSHPATLRSPITPLYYPYGSRYRYNSPASLHIYVHDPVPYLGCRLWSYNYLYWTC
jgi:hypothetical protein